MPVADFECPNCGAPVDFAGGSRATCAFCRSQLYVTDEGVKAQSVLNDLLDNQPAQPTVDVDHIQQLIADGKKIEAIKLVREQTDLGLKEAKDVVEAIERGEHPQLTPRTIAHGVTGVDLDQINESLLQGNKLAAIKLYREQTGVGLKEAKDAIEAIEATGWPPEPSPPGSATTRSVYRPPQQKTSTLGCLFGCLPTLLFIGLCAGFIMLSSHVMFRAFGPLEQALRVVNSDPEVVRAFGEPIMPGLFVTGEMSSGGSSSSADLSVPIYGPRRSGEMSISGDWRRGVWNLTIWITYETDDGEEQTITLSRQVK